MSLSPNKLKLCGRPPKAPSNDYGKRDETLNFIAKKSFQLRTVVTKSGRRTRFEESYMRRKGCLWRFDYVAV